MNLDDILKIDPTQTAITDEQKQVLNDNVDKLTDEQAQKFGVDKPAAPYIPEAPKEDDGNPKPGDGEGEDGEEVDPEDKKKINKMVQQQVAPLVQQSAEQGRQIAVDSYIRTVTDKIPTAGKYREAMLQTLRIPAYSKLKPQEVFNIVAGQELLRLGAIREREAAQKANGTRVNSSSARPAATQGKDWGTASKEDYAKKRAEVLGRPS